MSLSPGPFVSSRWSAVEPGLFFISIEISFETNRPDRARDLNSLDAIACMQSLDELVLEQVLIGEFARAQRYRKSDTEVTECMVADEWLPISNSTLDFVEHFPRNIDGDLLQRARDRCHKPRQPASIPTSLCWAGSDW